MRRSQLAGLVVALFLLGCDNDESPIPLVGTLERHRLELIAESREPIVELLVSEGQRVADGDLLVRLDSSISATNIAEAQAMQRRAEQRLAELIRGPRQERIREAQARLDGASDRWQSDKREYERIQKLVEDEIVNQSELDRAFAARQAAQTEHDRAEASLAELLEGTTREELAQARADVAQEEAAVARLEILASRLEVRAPRDGIVDAIPYRLGERPAAGATVVVLLDDSAPFARVYIPEPLRASVKAGLAAEIVIDGSDRTWAAEVRYVATEASFTPYFSLTQRDRSRFSYVAEIPLLDDEARELPSGLPLEVDFPSLR